MIAIEKIEKLNKQNLGLITLVTGEDIGQYSQLKSRLMTQIAFDKDDLTYSYFDMSETAYQDAEMDLLSLPFFAEQKVVIFDHLLDITTNKKSFLKEKDLKAFEAYLENPLETTRLIIFAPGKLDSKRRLVKLLKRDAIILEASPLKEAELRTYFQKYSHQLGLGFESGAFDQLLLKSNDDFSQIMKNMAFLKAYKKTGNISLTDIEQAIPKSLQDNIFDLTRLVLGGKVDVARDLIHDLRLSGEDDIKLIAIMLGQFRLYLQLAILAKEGKSEQQLVTSLSEILGRRVNPYQVKYAIKDSRTLSLKELAFVVKTLIETDYQIKTGVYEKQYLVDIALLKMVTTLQRSD
ncbi:DNA polymerase III subunit delta [Streptococcus dysgalactiae subsp. equisimilis]|uniref:DNA polymerase III subunit delta n=1 Tax=Streptococcus dysgalactiae TaxID=1334 RepID=UPI000617AABB|nr:DNA polymerase III subunit delta [Streptococcus dysgalactiae]KKC21251.1 DNA polymerase III subunit delta [Streptococcus dysgalactiae subsp. equisimilis]OBZ00377.1 DNA polymerase III subunit delta [Streptococcus dysgalactiae subsp. equisimilis]OBZ01107.1 DNA polymerase III subunit delta [Streptococcus dysgalactiae subsp. equisimilis]OCX03621.1 DNA polymerase III subunit delta [Streptococcus dysgalactiae subsp. equisimilis]SLM21017.1 DNA polymerase III subunit delta [Streptococcus dysgalactia